MIKKQKTDDKKHKKLTEKDLKKLKGGKNAPVNGPPHVPVTDWPVPKSK